MRLSEFRKRFVLFQNKEERQRRYQEFRKVMRKTWRDIRLNAGRMGGIK